MERKKAKEATAQKLTTPVKRKVKNIEQKLRKKYTKFSEEKSCKKGTSSSQVRPQNSKLTVSKAIWNHVLQKSKYKMVRSLKVSTEIPKGINRANGMEIGVSISNPYEISQENDTLLQRERLFFERQEMVRACPDTKKMVPHPFEKGEKVPARYLLGTIKMLHFSFEAETGVKCSLECFRQNIIFYLLCPKPNDWGTILCVHCINSEMKLEALANLTKDTSFHLEDGKSYEDIDGLVERIKATNIDKMIMYNEWQRVEQERTSSAKACSKRKTFQSKKFIGKLAML